MSEMKLIMESWRAFRLEEEEGPKFKEDKEDAIGLVDKVANEKDRQKKQIVSRALESDKDIAPVMDALEELFKELKGEEIEEGIEQAYDDMTATASGAVLDASSKVSEFLNSTSAGRVLKTVSGPVMGLALLGLFMQSPGEAGNLHKSAASIAQVITSPDPAEALAAAADAITSLAESLSERKKN